MASWQVQEAKTKLSKLIELANREGPQTITKHGKARAVVISVDDGVDLERSSDTGREIEFD